MVAFSKQPISFIVMRFGFKKAPQFFKWVQPRELVEELSTYCIVSPLLLRTFLAQINPYAAAPPNVGQICSSNLNPFVTYNPGVPRHSLNLGLTLLNR